MNAKKPNRTASTYWLDEAEQEYYTAVRQMAVSYRWERDLEALLAKIQNTSRVNIELGWMDYQLGENHA